MPLPPPRSTLFPYTTLFRSDVGGVTNEEHPAVAIVVEAERVGGIDAPPFQLPRFCVADRSEEHTSELQSRVDLVCRLLLEKKKRYSMHTAGQRYDRNNV